MLTATIYAAKPGWIAPPPLEYTIKVGNREVPVHVDKVVAWPRLTGNRFVAVIHGCDNNVLARTNTHISHSYIWGLSQNAPCFLQLQSTAAGGGQMTDNSTCDHLDGIETSHTTVNTGVGQSSDITQNFIVGSWNSCTWTSPDAIGQTVTNLTFVQNWCASDGQAGYKNNPQNGSVITPTVSYVNNRMVRYPQNAFGLTPNSWTDLRAGTQCGTVFDDNNVLVPGGGAAC